MEIRNPESSVESLEELLNHKASCKVGLLTADRFFYNPKVEPPSSHALLVFRRSAKPTANPTGVLLAAGDP